MVSVRKKKNDLWHKIAGSQNSSERIQWLVVSSHLKILYSHIGSFPQVGVKIKNIWSHQPVNQIHDRNHIRSMYVQPIYLSCTTKKRANENIGRTKNLRPHGFIMKQLEKYQHGDFFVGISECLSGPWSWQGEENATLGQPITMGSGQLPIQKKHTSRDSYGK